MKNGKRDYKYREQKVQLSLSDQEETSSPEQGPSGLGTETRAEYNH